MFKRFVKLLKRLWEANFEVIESRRTDEWGKMRIFVGENSESEMTSAQRALKIRDRLKVLIQPGLSRYEAEWIIDCVVRDLESVSRMIELEKEQARELAVNAYKFLEESHE